MSLLKFFFDVAPNLHPPNCLCLECTTQPAPKPKSDIKLSQCDFCYDMVGPGHICPEMSAIKITKNGHEDSRTT